MSTIEVMKKALAALEGIMLVESRGRIMPVGKEWDAAREAHRKLSQSIEQMEKAEPVAVVADVFELRWIGSEPIAEIIARSGVVVGSKLYTHPAPLRELSDEEIWSEYLYNWQPCRGEEENFNAPGFVRAILKAAQGEKP